MYRSVRIYSIGGKLLCRETGIGSMRLMTNLPQGLYLVHYTTREGVGGSLRYCKTR
jgi:hypothetical protein